MSGRSVKSTIAGASVSSLWEGKNEPFFTIEFHQGTSGPAWKRNTTPSRTSASKQIHFHPDSVVTPVVPAPRLRRGEEEGTTKGGNSIVEGGEKGEEKEAAMMEEGARGGRQGQ